MLATSLSAYSQPTSGLFAHWDMNGTANDMSGGGHNGHMNNLVPATGIDGVAGHAWYFNGTNSSITIPYASDMNVPAFTIAAVMKVSGFYSGTCHANMVFIRGKTGTPRPCSYYLAFSDGPAGYGCTPTLDTTQESFTSIAIGPSGALGPSTFTDFNDTPHIEVNKWYNLVVTFNDTAFKIYINDTLKTTVLAPVPGLPMGTSTDSAAIGFAPYDGPGYPYRFKGVMDDIKLYNRALSACEVSKLTHWTTTLITANPVNETVLVSGTGHFSISDTGIAGSYQWQVNTGTGYTNVPASAPYSGSTTKVLTVNPVTTAMDGYLYRCIRTSFSGCVDTSTGGKLVISTTGTYDLTRTDITIVPNPAKNMLTVSAPVTLEKVEVLDLLGHSLISEQPHNNFISLKVEALPAGIYLLRLNESVTARFVKE